MGINVLSLFDGIGTGMLALKRAGITVDNYFASEVDKYAIKVALKNHPEIKEIGDVKQIKASNLLNIDLLIGGSPCQDLSIAKTDRKGLKGNRSGLFFEYVRLLNEIKPKYFLLENVASMSKESKQEITKYLGVEPILINSALVSAQQRKRLYWTNIPIVNQIKDKGILLKDILETGVTDRQKARAVISSIGRTTEREFFKKKQGTMVLQPISNTNEKVNKVYIIKDKYISLGDKYKIDLPDGYYTIRKLTPIECERLQTLPDNYTEGVSNTQRYKMIGNGWTADVIAHIFNGLKKINTHH